MKPGINLAICGNPRKHTQSFDALKKFLKEYNDRINASTDSLLPIYIYHLNYHSKLRKFLLCDEESEKGLIATTEETEGKEPIDPQSIDVVLHKVHTYGDPQAVKAFQKWMEVVDTQRTAHHLRCTIIIDPLEKVNLLTIRSILYRLLDTDIERGVPATLIPRTYRWEVGTKQSVPVGIRSLGLFKEKVNGTWWIAKPEEGTGPSYTHHLTLWRSPSPRIPPAVQERLPKEEKTFIIQEFYSDALPVVVKVYCIGERVFIKVKPTLHLLNLLVQEEKMDTPVVIDSQDGALFKVEGEMGIDTPPKSCWDSFFAKDGAPYAHILQLAHNISTQTDLNLHLFGFDVLLLPRDKAHTYSPKLLRTIGKPKGKLSHAADPRNLGSGTTVGGLLPASSMFDPKTGAPTPLLLNTVPVTIDVNYFPGYSGMDSANADIAHLVQTLYTESQTGKETNSKENGSKFCAVM